MKVSLKNVYIINYSYKASSKVLMWRRMEREKQSVTSVETRRRAGWWWRILNALVTRADEQCSAGRWVTQPDASPHAQWGAKSEDEICCISALMWSKISQEKAQINSCIQSNQLEWLITIIKKCLLARNAVLNKMLAWSSTDISKGRVLYHLFWHHSH